MHLYGRWVFANAIGELLGLGLVGVVASQAHALPFFPVLMVALGACEGLIVGAFQHWAMREALPRLRARAWIAATVLGATVAWMAGMLPSTMMHGGAGAPPSPFVRFVGAVVIGLAAGPILALFQWRVLRRHVVRAALWMPANAFAWAAGMPVIFVAASRAVHGDPISALALVAFAGAIVGAIHGIVLVRVTRMVPA